MLLTCGGLTEYEPPAPPVAIEEHDWQVKNSELVQVRHRLSPGVTLGTVTCCHPLSSVVTRCHLLSPLQAPGMARQRAALTHEATALFWSQLQNVRPLALLCPSHSPVSAQSWPSPPNLLAV